MRETIAFIADGKILESKNAVLPIYSITKTMIASIVLDLNIDLENVISRWIPRTICPHSDIVKIRHLMNHSSGIRDYGNLPEYINDVENRKLAWSDEKFITTTVNRELLFSPGTNFAYSNPGYWLLKKIIETESNLSFDELIKKYIVLPLGLSSLKVAHGVFDNSLNGYVAEWVWHGLVMADATDVALFMASDKVARLNSSLNKVNYKDKYWQNPYYGLGLMVEPGDKYGHLGGGPGYEAACIYFLESQIIACAIFSNDKKINPLEYLFAQKDILRRKTSTAQHSVQRTAGTRRGL
ncbi:MAG: beta-lactamase family protein [Bacteroidia bacterium]|nr:beta-lactamase family protein [Bacteroidia bacterium]MCZ2356633.1 beta-lactamase family protein [Bacteroidia bacterium]